MPKTSKRMPVWSRNEGEDWADKVVRSVTKVQQVVSGIHQLMQDMRSWNKDAVDLDALYEACIEVMDAAVPPKKRKHTSSICCITKSHLPVEEGVEILKRREAGSGSKPASQVQEIVVHPRFMHFFNMLWFVCRIDHILRNVAKGWMASSSGSSSSGGSNAQQKQHQKQQKQQRKQRKQNEPLEEASSQIALMHSMRQEETQVEGIGMCQKFADQHAETIASMGVMFQHASLHVYRSLLRLKSN